MMSLEPLRLMRVPYALRRIPREDFGNLADPPSRTQPGDVILARVTKIAKNAHLELTDGRRCTLHEGDVIAAVFGNRYATLQFEGLATRNGASCDMLSMAGLCGQVKSRHSKVAEPTKLQILGSLINKSGAPLNLRNYQITASAPQEGRPHVVVVCGSSMDAGKTYTATSLIKGLSAAGKRVAGIKLTGTAAGKDTWNMLDAGADVAYDFLDGGIASTYLCDLDELIALADLLIGNAAAAAADYVVVEIADGLLQRETTMLLQSSAFQASVDSWLFAGGDPMAGESGVRLMRQWGIEPLAISGVLTMSKLNIREVEEFTGKTCVTAAELQAGALNGILDGQKLSERAA